MVVALVLLLACVFFLTAKSAPMGPWGYRDLLPAADGLDALEFDPLDKGRPRAPWYIGDEGPNMVGPSTCVLVVVGRLRCAFLWVWMS